LAGLSLRDLAKQVGMQAPSLYSYFASKHDIYDAMFAQGCHEFASGQPAVDELLAVGPLAGLKKLCHFFVAFCTADPVRYQLMFQRTIPGFEPSPESFAISMAGMQEMLRWFEAAGINAPGAADLYTAIGTGLTDQQISNDPGGDRWIQLVDDAMEMFFNHVQAKQQAPKGKRKR
jgi:AcrR family transcriptional regulator